MYKKIIAAVLCIAILAGSSVVLANKLFEQNEMLTFEEMTEYEVSEINENNTDRIINMANYIKGNKYTAAADTINEIIFNYAYIVQVYSTVDSELDYIDSLIYNGADVEDIISIYEFWLTTNENIDIIGQIYNMKGDTNNGYWIEDAFNQITENKHGVLNVQEINEYINKGLQVADIRTANLLCRKGVYNIQEILDMRIEGNSWDKIVSDIEPGNAKTTKVDDPAIIMTASDISLKTDISICNYIMNDYAVENIESKAEETELKTEQEVYETLTNLVVLIDPLISNNNNAELVQEIKSIIIENGVSESELEELINNGYMLMNILNASEAAKSENVSIIDALNNGGEA